MRTARTGSPIAPALANQNACSRSGTPHMEIFAVPGTMALSLGLENDCSLSSFYKCSANGAAPNHVKRFRSNRNKKLDLAGSGRCETYNHAKDRLVFCRIQLSRRTKR